LRGEGILLRDSANEFRNFGEVLDEVAGRWTSFSEVSQRAIASAFAGTHHMEQFMVLMEGYGKATEYTEKSLNSSGEAMQKFEDYQKSVTAHIELFNKSIQDLARTAVDSGLVNWFIDLGTIGVKSVDGLVSGFKELTSLFGLLDGSIGGTLGALSGLAMNKFGIGERTMFQWRLVLRPPF
jgi:TP901 family phage tail tape measure protein